MTRTENTATVTRDRRLALLGAPVEVGAGRRGCIMGPAALRTAELSERLRRLGYAVDDHGDAAPVPVDALELPGNARYAAEIAGWARSLDARTYALLRDGATPVILGGDHSLSMGSVTGVARWCADIGRELFVLWLDAHADFNTPATSPSGNMHGMPVACFCGEAGFEGLFGDEPRVTVDPANVTMVGVRSIDEGERSLLRDRGVEVIDMRTIDEFGVAAPMRGFLDRVAERNGLIHVSLDVDFLDPGVAPGAGTAVPGGATFREAHLIMELLHDSGRVASVDVVELNPFLDERGRSAVVLAEMTASLFGLTVLDRPVRPVS
ncbi:arginase [alpha proteobacterium BAL199]|nr:arginase [alpha proteobacterium BAL199]